MHPLVALAASEGIPLWFVEAAAIEYLDCRDYEMPPTIWRFDFDRIRIQQLQGVLRNKPVTIRSTLLHNYRLLPGAVTARLVSAVPMPPARNVLDLIPEGPVASYHTPSPDNPIEAWDPKLNFSSHIQVWDRGRLWQWSVARFVTVPGRSFGRWESDELDLSAIEDLDIALAKLRNAHPTRWSPFARRAFKRRVAEFYARVEVEREPIREAARALHERRLRNFATPGHVSRHEPPMLSNFDQFEIRYSRIHTSFNAEPLFYRACAQHCQRAIAIVEASKTDNDRFAALDELRTEKVSAVLFAVACIEAMVNSYGAELVSDWARRERAYSIEDKFASLLALGGQSYDPHTGTDAEFQRLVRLRNTWVHYRKAMRPTVTVEGRTLTAEDAELNEKLMIVLPGQVSEIITRLAIACGKEPAPPWLASSLR
jgi:hypothetical protein